MVMNRADPDWATITSYENLPGCPQPMAATRAWLRERGIDWMPLSDNEIRSNLACGQVLMVDGMAGPASRSAPMRFADSVCIQTNPPRSFAGAAFGLVARCRRTPSTMTAVHVAPDPSTAKGSSPARQF
jgi:hypothetical protein